MELRDEYKFFSSRSSGSSKDPRVSSSRIIVWVGICLGHNYAKAEICIIAAKVIVIWMQWLSRDGPCLGAARSQRHGVRKCRGSALGRGRRFGGGECGNPESLT